MSVSMKFGLSSGMRGLLNKASLSVQEALAKAAPDAINAVNEFITVYPGELPNQYYKRTYTLQNSWWSNIEFKNTGTGTQSVEIMIGNDAQQGGKGYAAYVIGPWTGQITQAPIHRYRWPTVSGLKRDVSPLVQSIFRDAIYQELRKKAVRTPTVMVWKYGFDEDQSRVDYWWDKEAAEGVKQRSLRQKITAKHGRRRLTPGSDISRKKESERNQKKISSLFEGKPPRRERHLAEAQRASIKARQAESRMTYPPQNPGATSYAKNAAEATARMRKLRGKVRSGEAYTNMSRTAYDKSQENK